MPINFSNLDSQTIIFGGLTLGLLYALYILWKSNKLFFNHTNDTIRETSRALMETARSNQRLADVIESNSKTIKNIEVYFIKNERIIKDN